MVGASQGGDVADRESAVLFRVAGSAMKAMLLCILPVLLLPSAGQAQVRDEVMADFRMKVFTKYEPIAAEEAPWMMIFLNKTTLRTVNDRPRAWFILLDQDEEQNWLMEADCLEQRVRLLSRATYDQGGELLESDDIPSEWMYAPPSSVGDLQLKRLCR
jgi:hypothetical protein